MHLKLKNHTVAMTSQGTKRKASDSSSDTVAAEKPSKRSACEVDYRLESAFSDVTVECLDGTLYFSRWVLAQESPVLRSLISDADTEIKLNYSTATVNCVFNDIRRTALQWNGYEQLSNGDLASAIEMIHKYEFWSDADMKFLIERTSIGVCVLDALHRSRHDVVGSIIRNWADCKIEISMNMGSMSAGSMNMGSMSMGDAKTMPEYLLASRLDSVSGINQYIYAETDAARLNRAITEVIPAVSDSKSIKKYIDMYATKILHEMRSGTRQRGWIYSIGPVKPIATCLIVALKSAKLTGSFPALFREVFRQYDWKHDSKFADRPVDDAALSSLAVTGETPLGAGDVVKIVQLCTSTDRKSNGEKIDNAMAVLWKRFPMLLSSTISKLQEYSSDTMETLRQLVIWAVNDREEMNVWLSSSIGGY